MLNHSTICDKKFNNNFYANLLVGKSRIIINKKEVGERVRKLRS